MPELSIYIALKILHLAALIFWLGPSLGAWWLLRRARQRFGDPGMVSQFLYYLFLKILWLEHGAFFIVLISGLGMAMISGAFDQNWFQYKIALIVTIIVPLEVIDIWLGHYRLPTVFHQRHPATPYTQTEKRLLHFYHQRFTPFALIILPPTIIAILFLALNKLL